MRASGTLEAPPPLARRRRRLRIVLGILLSLAVLGTAFVLLLFYLADKDLREAIDEADHLDPGWRLENLEAKRADIPQEQNAARVVLSAAGLLPKPWPPWRAEGTPASQPLEKSFDTLAPAEQLDAQQTQDLRTALTKAQPALAEARKLMDLPNGRYPSSFSPDGGILTPQQPHIVHMRELVTLLSFDVLLRAQENDADGALASGRGIVNVGRSVGDEPMFFSQLVRMESRSAACAKIERILAQAQPSEAALAAAQRLLEQEEVEPLFLIGARGQRAGWHTMLGALRDGDLPGIGNGLKIKLFSSATFSSRPALLYLNTQIVEIAKLPVEQQLQRLKEEALFGRKRIMDYPTFARIYFVPKVEKITTDLANGQARTQAQLRCATAAVACERYRRANGNWPSSLATLAPAYLVKVPVDPFDGQPLRLRRLEKGMVIYSVGPDGLGNGDILVPEKPHGPGFRLWDEQHRRQPPKR